MDITTVLFIILAVIASLAIAIFQYFYKSKSRTKGIILLAFLRFLGLFLMLLLLINPKIESRTFETLKPKLVLAVDNSSSIKELRGDLITTEFLNSIKKNSILNKKFDIDQFSFGANLRQADSLTFTENSTNISQALASLNTLYNENAAVLLVTDGNQTLGADYSFYKSKSKLFPVIVGDTTKQEDIKISKLNANKYAFLGNNFPVEVFVNYEGVNTVNATVLVQNGNTTVFRKNVSLSSENNSAQITFTIPATQVGVKNYNTSISVLNNEKNTINNRKSFTVEVIDEQSKIAIISDITHPDLGMLKRSIETNKQRKVVLLSPTDDINFKDYQLLLLYQPNAGFATIFKDIEEDPINTFMITGPQTDWNFLNGVQNNFQKDVITQTEDYLGAFNPNYGAFVVDDTDFDNFSPLQAFFGDITFNIPHEVLLFQNVDGFETENPLLATYATNDRRGAVLFGENSWKWRALSYVQHKSFAIFDSFINSIIQYLATTKKFNRIELDYSPIAYQNDLIKIAATYFDNNYTIDTRAALVLTIKNTETQQESQYPLRLNKNVFEANLSDLKSADYIFSVRVKGQNLIRNGSFTILDYNIEQQFTYANVDGLNALAIHADGKAFHIDQSQELIQFLEADTNYKSIQKSVKKSVPLVDWKWLLGLIVLCFSFEWFIRKYRGLI